MARPEGPLVVAALALATRPGRFRVPGLLLAALPALAWQSWRLGFYGAWLPNTLWAKATGEPTAQVLSGIALIGLIPTFTPPRVLRAALAGHTLPQTARQEGSLVPASLDVAAWLRDRLPPGAVVAVNHAGALGYGLLEWNVLDMTGLNDAHIAHAEGGLHEKYDPDYVLAQHPTVVVLNGRVRPGRDGIWYHSGYWAAETALVQHSGFMTEYQAVPVAWERRARGRAPAWILVFVRRDLAGGLGGEGG